jgi:hypothetical protein
MNDESILIPAEADDLASGRFSRVMSEFDALEQPNHVDWARRVVAAAMMDDDETARQALDQLAALAPIDTNLLATTWLKGLLGHLINEQTDARQAGTDPVISMLPALAHQAAATLERAMHDDSSRGRGFQLGRFDALRNLCLEASGGTRGEVRDRTAGQLVPDLRRAA